jgi:beta-glucanase (GH16 family)
MRRTAAGANHVQFYNNSQEIDMEFLSKEFNNSQGAVNLVMQTPESVVHGYDASGTPAYRVQHLDFRPDEKVHEYRFDWSPGSVVFYVDGQWQYEMTDNIPVDPGRMFLNHWSNGDPLWSAGPPGADTAMTVTYVKAYFNTTNTERNDAYKKRCTNWNATQVCEIPTQLVAPDYSGDDGNVTANTYFFSLDGGDKTPGQEVFKTTNAASSIFGSTSMSIYIPVIVALFSWAFAI